MKERRKSEYPEKTPGNEFQLTRVITVLHVSAFKQENL